MPIPINHYKTKAINVLWTALRENSTHRFVIWYRGFAQLINKHLYLFVIKVKLLLFIILVDEGCYQSSYLLQRHLPNSVLIDLLTLV